MKSALHQYSVPTAFHKQQLCAICNVYTIPIHIHEHNKYWYNLLVSYCKQSDLLPVALLSNHRVLYYTVIRYTAR